MWRQVHTYGKFKARSFFSYYILHLFCICLRLSFMAAVTSPVSGVHCGGEDTSSTAEGVSCLLRPQETQRERI